MTQLQMSISVPALEQAFAASALALAPIAIALFSRDSRVASVLEQTVVQSFSGDPE